MSSIAIGQGLDLRFASIAASGLGTNPIVTPVADKRLWIVSFFLVAQGAVTAVWEDDDGTDLSGGMPFLTSGGIVCPGQASSPWSVTDVGKGLNLNLSAAVSVGGMLTYIQSD